MKLKNWFLECGFSSGMGFGLVQWALESSQNFHSHFSHHCRDLRDVSYSTLSPSLWAYLPSIINIKSGEMNFTSWFRCAYSRESRIWDPFLEEILAGYHHIMVQKSECHKSFPPWIARGLQTVALYHLSLYVSLHRLIQPRLKRDTRVTFW